MKNSVTVGAVTHTHTHYSFNFKKGDKFNIINKKSN